MLFILPFASQPYNWTTDATVLAWIAVVSLVVGILSIIIAFWLFAKSKQRKLITYKCTSDIPVVRIPSQAKQGIIRITYEDVNGYVKDINNARLVTLSIRNAGNLDTIIWNTNDIDLQSEEEPLEIEFEGRTVVALTQITTSPSKKIIQDKNLINYLNSIVPSQSSIGLPRCLLKPNQSIQLSILLNGPKKEIKLKRGRLLNGEVLDNESLEHSKKPVKIGVKIVALLLIGTIMTIILPIISKATYQVSSPEQQAASLQTFTYIMMVGWALIFILPDVIDYFRKTKRVTKPTR